MFDKSPNLGNRKGLCWILFLPWSNRSIMQIEYEIYWTRIPPLIKLLKVIVELRYKNPSYATQRHDHTWAYRGTSKGCGRTFAMCLLNGQPLSLANAHAIRLCQVWIEYTAPEEMTIRDCSQIAPVVWPMARLNSSKEITPVGVPTIA